MNNSFYTLNSNKYNKNRRVSVNAIVLHFLIVLSAIMTGCTNKNKTSIIQNSGIITYKISYSNESNDSVSARFLPKTLKVTYADNKLEMNIKTELNIFSINISSPGIIDSSFINLHFMGKDFSYKIAASELFFLYSMPSDPKIEIHKEDSIEIAGLICYKAIIKTQNESPYEIYYTNDLPIKKPNRHTPLSSIPGMLMSFPIKYNGLNFNIKAVSYENLNNEKWVNREYCVNSSNKEVKDLINSLINVIH